MNAPATQAQVRPAAARADDLVSLDLIRTLVGFDTTSRDSNLALIEWVRGYLAGFGVESTLTFDDEGRKANLFATLPARDGNVTNGGIVLSGHTDVVPVDGQPRDTDPFVTLKDGRLRGAALPIRRVSRLWDSFVPEFLRCGLLPIHFALSYDEEIGCIGVRRLIADIVARGVHPAGCIVGEPTGMELVVAHKGKKAWRCRVRGREAHSSLTPLGVNAVQIACESVAYIAPRTRISRRRVPGCRVRRPLYDGARGRHSRRHGAQHRAARLPVRL
jgi:acetylornithine deacetylase